MDGHLVTGHVDGVGRVVALREGEGAVFFDFEVPPELAGQIALRGSVAVDGVSLTVAGVGGTVFTVSIVPYTLEQTLFGEYRPGREVHIETDVLAKYVERALARTGGVRASPPGSETEKQHEHIDETQVDREFRFHTVEEALADLKAGKMVVVLDDEERENEGDVVCAAETITPAQVNFIITEARGLLCVPMSGERLKRLGLDPMVRENTAPMGTSFTVSVDAIRGSTTGISAQDRAITIRALADERTRPEDLARPGHVFPLRAVAGGVLRRPGHTEAVVDLMNLAGMKSVGVLCEILDEDGTMARPPYLSRSPGSTVSG